MKPRIKIYFLYYAKTISNTTSSLRYHLDIVSRIYLLYDVTIINHYFTLR